MDQFGFWLSASKKDVHSAHGKLCSRGNMGKSALFSHAKQKQADTNNPHWLVKIWHTWLHNLTDYWDQRCPTCIFVDFLRSMVQ